MCKCHCADNLRRSAGLLKLMADKFPKDSEMRTMTLLRADIYKDAADALDLENKK